MRATSCGRRWFRLDVEWDASEWLVTLEPLAQFAWIKLLGWVKVHGKAGRTRALSAVAAGVKWGLPTDAVVAMLEAAHAGDEPAIATEGSQWVILNWATYQEPDLTRNDRQRRFREAKGNTPVTPRNAVTLSRDHRPLTTTPTSVGVVPAHDVPGVSHETEPPPEPAPPPAPDELAAWLGDHAAALPDWPPLREPDLRRTLWNLYGPPGLRPNVWKREDGISAPPEDRPRLFVVALAGYATEGKRTMATNEFAGMLGTTVRAEYRQPKSSYTAPPGTPPDSYVVSPEAKALASQMRLQRQAQEAEAVATKQRAADGQRNAELDAFAWLKAQDKATQDKAAMLVRVKFQAQFPGREIPSKPDHWLVARFTLEAVQQIKGIVSDCATMISAGPPGDFCLGYRATAETGDTHADSVGISVST